MLLSDMIALRDARNTPPGVIRIVPTGQLPLGYAWLTGLELDRAIYSKAFNYFGTTWGAGNLTTTFNLPDMRSRLPGFAASMGGSQPTNWISTGGTGGSNVAPVLGATGGADRYAALDISQVPTHLHGFIKDLLSPDPAAGPVYSGGALSTSGTVPVYQVASTQVTGGGGPISVVPPIGIFNICVSLGREYSAVTPVPPPGFAATTEEFNGPFPNWINIVTHFHADPTGVSDSTSAFQAAAAAFSVQSESDLISVPDSGFVGFNDMYGCVLYIPPGTYKITETIQWGVDVNGNPATAVSSCAMIGDHADTVTLKWEGPAGGDIIWYCSIHAGAIRRITFDGNAKTARSGVRYEKIAGGISMTGGAVEDCIFKDFQTAGFYNTYETGVSGTDSEMSIYRNRFYRCGVGVYITQPQAFDYWVLCNYFEGCGIGVSNNINGQFHASYNFFNGSLNYDVFVSGGGSVVGAAMLGEVSHNYSTNSSRFIHFDSSNTTASGNLVVNPQQVDCFEFTTRITGSGGRNKGGLIGNKVYLPANATEGAVFHEIWQAPDSQFPLNPSAFSAQAQPTFIIYKNEINLGWDINNVISLDPRFPNVMLLANATGQTIDPTAPLIPAQPESISRQVFQLRLGSDAQSVVDAAAAFALANPGSRPVIYAPSYASGSPSLRSYQNTLIFPPNIEMSLQGDFLGIDWRSNISEDAGHWLGAPLDPLVLFQGPTLMTCMNMRISVSAETASPRHLTLGDVIVDNCDQVGGYAYLNNCFDGFHYDTCGNLVLNMTAKDTEATDSWFLPNFVKGDVTNPSGLGRVLLECATGSGQDDDFHPAVFLLEPAGKFFVRGYWGENNNQVDAPSDVYLWFDVDGTGSGVASWLSIEASRFVGGSGTLVQRFDNVSQFLMNNYTGNIILLDDFYLGIGTFTGDNSGAKWLSLSGDLALVDLPHSHNNHPPLVCMLNWSIKGFTNQISFDFSNLPGSNYVPTAGDLAIFTNSVVSAGEGGVADVTPAGLTLVGSFLPAIDTINHLSVNTAVFYRILDGTETNLTFMDGDQFNGVTIQVFRSYGGGTWGVPANVVQEVDPSYATTSTNYVAPGGPGVLQTFMAGVNNPGAPAMAPTAADADAADTDTIGASFIGYGVGDTPTSGTASTTFAQTYAMGSFFIPITGMALPSYPVPVHFQQEGLGVQMMSFNLDVFDSIPDGGGVVGFWGPRGVIGTPPADIAAQLDTLLATKVPTVVTTGQTPNVTSFYARRGQFDITFMKGVYTPTIG